MSASPSLSSAERSARPSIDKPGLGRDRRSMDLLDLLARAHRRYDHRCQQLRRSRDVPRDDLERFIADLLVHETLEELLLHPLVAERLPTGPELATDRLTEQRLLALSLHRLLVRSSTDPDLAARLAGLHQQLVEHDDREEIEVFPFFRHVSGAPELARLGDLYQQAHHRVSQALVDGLRDLQPAERSDRSRLLSHVHDAAEVTLLDLGAELPAECRA